MAKHPCDVFKVLGVETRVRIIELLKTKGPLGAKSIAEVLGITPAAVSLHLKILKQAGFVRSERKGFWIPYSIDTEALENCRDMVSEVCACGCQGHGVQIEKGLESPNLESLKTYEKKLLDELKLVRERIEKAESKGNG